MKRPFYRFWRIISIRSKLLIAFVTLVLLPIVATSAISTVMNFREGRKQVVARLESVAALKEADIKTWLTNLHNDLKIALEWDQHTIRKSWVLFFGKADPQAFDEAYGVLQSRFSRTIAVTERLDELFLLSRSGIVVLSTDSSKEGEFRGLQPYFRKGLSASGVHVQTLSYSSTSEGVNTVIAVVPIKDVQGQVLGVLCGRASLSRLNELMLVRAGFGETGETYLVGSNRVLLTELRFPGFIPGGVYIRTEGLKKALSQKKNSFGFYINYRQVPVIGVQRWIPELEVVLLAELSQAEAYGPIYTALAFDAAIALIAVLVAGIAALFVTRTIASPLTNLAGTASRIAGGELELTAEIERKDEIGVLAVAFNDMTAQLRELIGSLEQRVSERTAELKLQTIEKEAAEAANTAKSEFLARMSHEIRTPLNAVTGLTNIVLKSELTAEQRDYLNKVQIANNHLLEVINDILDFSKVEAGRLELACAPFDLDQILEWLADLFSNRVAPKDLELVFAVSPQVPRQLTGDAARLVQVLTNLIENAIKFTDQGEIVVGVETGDQIEKQDDAIVLQFRVRDTGAGITADVLPTLFDPFFQVDSSLTREHEGTGLGLAICRRLVELMGGRIWAESTPGKGSTFSFTVALSCKKKEKPRLSLPPNLHELKALVVDDSAAARQVLVDLLESFTFKVSAVDSSEKAIEELRRAAIEEPYQLVLLDWKMPGMDGIETARRIRAMPFKVQDEASDLSNRSLSPQSSALSTQPPPIIIMVTAYGHKMVQEHIDTSAADTWLSKPVKPSQLFNTIMELFGRKEAMEPHLAQEPTVRPTHTLSGRRVLVVEDSELNRDVVVALLEEAGFAVETAENGRLAVDKVTGAPGGTYDAVLMDIQMPVMDGYEATQRIRKWESVAQLTGHKLPIVALTAHALIGEKDKCLEAGMDDYLPKPLDEKQLERVLKKWIPPQKEKTDTAIPSQAGGDSDYQTILDIQGALNRLGGRKQLYVKLLEKFASQSAKAHATIAQYLAAGDREAATRTAHTVKGTAATIGAAGLSEIAEKLEKAVKNEATDIDGLMSGFKNELERMLKAVDSFLDAEA